MPAINGSANAIPGKITFLGLITTTYFMVAGGPYGLEDIVREAGYFGAIAALLVIPLIWVLPSTLMVSELSSALPEEGGYYVWVRRALGPFWGFQEGWLSLASSVFDMAIYPILFVTYLGFVGTLIAPEMLDWEGLKQPERGSASMLIGLLVIGTSTAMNLRPPRSVGRSSFWMTLTMLAPFVVLSFLALLHRPIAVEVAPHAAGTADFITALLFALWNYMGWDNATTFASDVQRPQRTYPLAMAGAVGLVAITYLVPVMATYRAGIPAGSMETGAWVTVAAAVGGRWLAIAVGLGGMISAFGIFNSLVLSYSRLPVVLAQDGYLPTVFTRRARSGAPWVAIVVCAVAWSLAAQLGLKRVLALDVVLYGLGLLLEFAALVALRVREPHLPRPFRVPGGAVVAVLLGLLPAALIGLAIFDLAGKWKSEEVGEIAPACALLIGAGLVACGPVLYALRRWIR